jgi:protease IV
MSLDTENIIERRRLRRKLGFWRGLAVVAFIAMVGAFAIYAKPSVPLMGSPQIARISITGLITEDRKQIELLKRLGRADHVKGVIVFVNSPGGTTTGGEALFEGLRELSGKKPVVAQFGTVAASAAYITGLATDHIVARGNSITGSVGVIMQWPEVSGLLEKLGVKMHEVKSGTLKAAPSMFHAPEEEARQVTKEMVAESQQWFLDLVRNRRKVDPATIPGLSEGRVYSGRMALKHKLVDAIGGEETAVEWLVEQRKLARGLKIVDWKPETAVSWPFAGALSGFLAEVVGETASRLGLAAETGDQFSRLGLDGFVSVWHPGKN